MTACALPVAGPDRPLPRRAAARRVLLAGRDQQGQHRDQYRRGAAGSARSRRTSPPGSTTVLQAGAQPGGKRSHAGDHLRAAADPGGRRRSHADPRRPVEPGHAVDHAGRHHARRIAPAGGAIAQDHRLHGRPRPSRNTATIVPNYTNGVAAQPNSYGHYLLGFVAGLAPRRGPDPPGLCQAGPLGDGHHGAERHQLAARPRADGACARLRRHRRQRLRRRADLGGRDAGRDGRREPPASRCIPARSSRT